MIVTFAYLLCPIIRPNILKRPLEQIMIFKVAKHLADVIWNHSFAAKQNIFWEIWLLLLSTYCTVLYYNTSKKILCDQIIRQGCIILAQIGPELPFPPKGNFLEK